LQPRGDGQARPAHRARRHREDLLQPDPEGHGRLHLRPVRLGPLTASAPPGFRTVPDWTTRRPPRRGPVAWSGCATPPAATIATSRGRPSLRAPLSTSNGTLPMPTPTSVMPLPRRIPAGRLIVGAAIAPIWTNRVAW